MTHLSSIKNKSKAFFNFLAASISFCLLINSPAFAQQANQQWHYAITLDPGSKIIHVSLKLSGNKADTIPFKIPAWTTGYYQFMNFDKNLSAFSATDGAGKPLAFTQSTPGTWKVAAKHAKVLMLQYDIKANRNFVAGNFLDENHAFISPAGVFLYAAGNIKQPVTLTIKQFEGWNRIATGMDHVAGDIATYYAPDFDILYDSPILMGKLEALPAFKVNGIQHDFIGYKMGSFDKQQFMDDMKKIVENGSAIIGDIPYNHYTFLAIGPGGGGIEHLNSAAVAFDGNVLNTAAGRIKLYSFLAHEYFHNYNVKRIRPIELGPFDYENGSKTEMLWVSEGFTVYYEYMILRRAGLTTSAELISQLRTNLLNYEAKPGHLYQSATQSSTDTWSDGPFGRTGDEVNKTISYYDKGPLLGLMIDLKIRHETQNKKSLDDVMRTLYHQYYQKLKRGFTPQEFKQVCEQTAGVPLTELFEYASTVKEVNYHKYFAYAGLSIDDTVKTQPGAWLGITAQNRKDTLTVTDVDWQSPAWNAGIRNKCKIMMVDGKPATADDLKLLSTNKKAGDVVTVDIIKNGKPEQVKLVLGVHNAKSFEISPVLHPDQLQQEIYKSVFDGGH
ncbi:M61 family metallopeptidase [Mucilaginibacter sp.]|uniref:M61 family metallopeptidase n=1 Tax=Mucilaginibacter sp. TaxID=1882438 RepID=UPI003D14977B